MPAPDPHPLAEQTIGFIGLGLMGRPMARHLHAAGARLVLHNRSRAGLTELLPLGHTEARTPRTLAKTISHGLIILMLTNTAAVSAVTDGPDGLLAGLRPGTLVIDMGASGVEETRRWAKLARQQGAAWLDAPVSGGQAGALAATLAIMAGGEPEDFRRAQPVLTRLGTPAWLGPSGAGQCAKLANQIIVAVTLTAIAEAFTLARAAGADLRTLRTSLLAGFASSRLLDQHGLRMIDENFTPGGRATGQLKDLVEARRLARQCGLHLPVLESNLPLWTQLVAANHGDLDHSAILKLYGPTGAPLSAP